MESSMTVDDLYQFIAKAVLGESPSDDDALALMILLHTHHLRLAGVVFTDRPGVSELAAITQRHAAEVIAGAWPDRADRESSGEENGKATGGRMPLPRVTSVVRYPRVWVSRSKASSAQP